MQAPRHFSETYKEARTRFVDAATRTGAPLESITNPCGTGPTGEALVTDVALFGRADATKLLILLSGTHGVEGFAGSGAQVSMIESLRFTALPARTAVLAIHAINPYGFAWLRRVNEDNVDLNRNSVDFANPPKLHEDFATVAPYLVPPDWSDLGPAEERIKAFIEAKGFKHYQEVVTAGQYTNPEGLFYGGTAPVWSTRTFRDIVTRYGKGKQRIAVIDFHSGLGPLGYGEPMYTGSDPAEAERVRDWYGPAVTVMHAGSSSSIVVSGPLITSMSSFFDGPSRPEITTLVLEFGTLHEEVVHDVLRAEAWMHAQGDSNFDTPVGRALRRRFRDCFYVATDAWKRSVVDRSVEMTGQALAGLAS